MHEQIPDFNDTELWFIRQAVSERFRKEIDTQNAGAELRLHPSARELTLCPVVYWKEQGCHFVIFKVGEKKPQPIFYSVRDQYGTGHNEYTDLGECVTTLLQVQADHAAKRAADPNI